ncbi:MAG: site-specific integrase, partial [Thermoplasmatales archaeon]
MIKVRAELSKSKKPYFTFIGQQGCEYLKEYLEYRIRTGEKLNQDSPVITAKISKKKHFVSTMNIGDQVRKAIRASGLNQRPYVLRAYFDTQLMMAENKGLIMRDYRTFMMGHVGDIEHRYTLNKNNLPEDVIEDMRESYSKSLRFLETERRGIKEEEMNEKINDFKRMMLILAGYSNDEIDREKMLELSNEDLAKKIDEKKAKSLNNGHSQKVVSMKEIRQYIEQGWEF